MTQPNPLDSITAQDEQDALSEVSRMLTGTKALQNEPGLVYSLAQQKASPQDAQAIDQFVQSLEAEKRVALARAAGSQIILSPNEQDMLRHNGVTFRDVLYTQQDFAKSVTQRIMDASGGSKTPVLNSDGTLQTDANGHIVLQDVHHSDGGWFSSFSSFFDHLGGAIAHGFGDVLHGLNKAWNFVEAGFRGEYASQVNPLIQPGSVLDPDRTRAQDMIDQGYDPNSIWSTFAFGASGKAHGDLSSLNDAYGQDRVDAALQYMKDPEAYRKTIYNDPNNYTVDSQGREQMTAEAKAKLNYLQSSEFSDLAHKIQANSATIGDGIATALGIDPLEHPDLYKYTALGTDLAASFLIDPTIVAFKVAQGVKRAQVGLDTLGDTSAASILTRKGFFARRVQAGWQRGIDLAGQFRDAMAKGDTATAAAVTAQFRAELPGLEPIWENFTGGERVFQGYHGEELVNGKLVGKPVFGPSDGFHTLDDAALFIEQKAGLLRLMSGRAATQSGLMPGALSAFGYRKLKGITAGWMTARSAARMQESAKAVLSAAEADPALAEKLIDDGILARMQAQPDDAVHFFDGSVLAAKYAESGDATLASAERGKLVVTGKGIGAIKRNLRYEGTEIGNTALGRFSGTAIAERFRQAGIRLSTLLPRNSMIDITDARSGDILYKTALTFLNRGEANTLRALWNTADFAQRKVMVHALIDQLGHAAGLGKTATGRVILQRAKTAQEAYMASGDEIVLDGEKVAGFEGQTRTTWMLPSFQQMQKAAHRISLGEATFGRAFSSDMADTIMGQWKMGALFKPSTVSRNMLEGWLRTILEGRAGDALKARAIATARHKELWDRGFGVADRELYVEQRGIADSIRAELDAGGLTRAQRAQKFADLREAKRLMATVETKPIVQHLLATEAGDEELAKSIANSSMLSGDILGRSKLSNWLANTAPLAAIGRAYRLLIGTHMDEETLQALLTYGPDELREAMENYGLQLFDAEMGFGGAARAAGETADKGFGPALIRFAVHRAKKRGEALADKEAAQKAAMTTDGLGVQWTHHAIDGTKGADRYSTALSQRVNAMPETARAALAHIEDRYTTPLSKVVEALEAESKNTAFGHVYFPDVINAPSVARRAATDAEAEVGKLDWANKVVNEYRYLLTGQNGEYAQELADYIKVHGYAPDGEWIDSHLKGDKRPESVLSPVVMAMAPGGVQKIPQLLQDIEGGAYQWMVERPLQRTTSAPVFLANYAIARKGLNGQVERLIEEGGMSREAAENLARELATRNAWVKTEQLIDDPGQKAQFDVIARNMFPFARATQAMIRRWATGLWQNPVAARKMMLAYEGAVHSGLIYNNAYGEPTFTYPGSGVMSLALRGLAEVPGWKNIAAFPMSADMTGQVLMSVPGADNPFRMSMGPMISIPFREVYTHLLPYLHAHLGINTAGAQEELMKLDSIINGPIGTGETLVQLVPTAVRKFYAALNGDDRNSAIASAMKGAIANLAAAGLAPPPDASAAVKQAFLSRVQTQVKTQLFLRAVFGMFAPAAPSAPTDATSASGADYAWSLDGIKQLSDEYKQILNDVGGDVGRATAIWTAMHPDRVVYDPSGDIKAAFYAGSAYETPETQSVSPGAYLPSTDATLHWLDRNADFVSRYKNVAAYFLPIQAANEPFSDAAYKAQIEFGLRERKTPEEFMRDIYVRNAENVFYPADHALNAQIAQARAEGDTTRATQLTQLRHDWQQQFYALNPYFKDKIDGYGDARKIADEQLSNLRQMVTDNDVPDGLGQKLATVIKAYDNYQQFLNAHQGQSNANVAAKQQALTVMNQWATQELAGTPLENVWNGVFRVLNSNFDTIGGA